MGTGASKEDDNDPASKKISKKNSKQIEEQQTATGGYRAILISPRHNDITDDDTADEDINVKIVKPQMHVGLLADDDYTQKTARTKADESTTHSYSQKNSVLSPIGSSHQYTSRANTRMHVQSPTSTLPPVSS